MKPMKPFFEFQEFNFLLLLLLLLLAFIPTDQKTEEHKNRYRIALKILAHKKLATFCLANRKCEQEINLEPSPSYSLHL